MDLEATLRRLAPNLLRYCRGQVGDGSLAEEVAQEALTALVERWRRHGPPDCPAAFVFRIAKRRGARRLVRRRLSQPLEILFGVRDPGPDPAQRTLSRLDLAAVNRALGRLAGRDREALLLVVAGELELKPAAELLGISVSALKMRLHRARRRLAELLEVNDEESRNVEEPIRGS